MLRLTCGVASRNAYTVSRVQVITQPLRAIINDDFFLLGAARSMLVVIRRLMSRFSVYNSASLF